MQKFYTGSLVFTLNPSRMMPMSKSTKLSPVVGEDRTGARPDMAQYHEAWNRIMELEH